MNSLMIMESKIFGVKIGKYEVCDGLYNSLLCVIILKKNQSPSHTQKDVFMTSIKYKCSKRLKVRHINLDMEKDVNFNIVPKVFVSLSNFLCLKIH